MHVLRAGGLEIICRAEEIRSWGLKCKKWGEGGC